MSPTSLGQSPGYLGSTPGIFAASAAIASVGARRVVGAGARAELFAIVVRSSAPSVGPIVDARTIASAIDAIDNKALELFNRLDGFVGLDADGSDCAPPQRWRVLLWAHVPLRAAVSCASVPITVVQDVIRAAKWIVGPFG